MTSFGTHDFDEGVVVVAARRMYWYTSRLVDHDHIVVFVDNTNRLRGYGRFMTVQSMRDHVSVAYDMFDS